MIEKEKQAQIDAFKARIMQTQNYQNSIKKDERTAKVAGISFIFLVFFGFLLMIGLFQALFYYENYTVSQMNLSDLVKTERVVDTMWVKDTFQRHNPIRYYSVRWKNIAYYEKIDSSIFYNMKKIPADSVASYYYYTPEVEELVRNGGNIRHLDYKGIILENWYDTKAHAQSFLPVIIGIISLVAIMMIALIIIYITVIKYTLKA